MLLKFNITYQMKLDTRKRHPQLMKYLQDIVSAKYKIEEGNK